MNRVLFRQPGLFAHLLRRQNGGLMAVHCHGPIIPDHINGSKRGHRISVRNIDDQ